MKPFESVVESVEAASALDAPGEAVARTVRGVLSPGGVKDAISGTWLGHALHPMLTDVIIGSFTSATMLDLFGGKKSAPASERLIAIGIAAYGPTALTGVSDWTDSEYGDDAVRLVGVVHAGSNALALALYTASLRARRRGARGKGIVLGGVGAGVLGFAGYLGGHLTFAKGVGVDQTSFDPGPDEWHAAADVSQLAERTPVSVVVDETPVCLLRDGDTVHAVHDRCSHRGCSLSDGTLDGVLIECPCHGSRFDVRDGSIARGPATQPQPAFEVREREGQIEIRLAKAR